MKFFHIKRETTKGNIYHRETKVYKYFLWWKVRLLYCYGIRVYNWCVPGCRQALQPLGPFWTFGKKSDKVIPSSTKWETEYLTKEMFTYLKPKTKKK